MVSLKSYLFKLLSRERSVFKSGEEKNFETIKNHSIKTATTDPNVEPHPIHSVTLKTAKKTIFLKTL